MAFAMRINFVDVVCDDSMKNIFANGKKVGYQFDIRLSYYRGHFLSVIDEFGRTPPRRARRYNPRSWRYCRTSSL